MPYQLLGRTISTVGIVGSGQIGPDIAFHTAMALAPSNVSIVVIDIKQEALDAGKARLRKKIAKLVEAGQLKAEKAAHLENAITFSTEMTRLKNAEFVIEAASEALTVKQQIFAQLETICANDALLTSNSSHLEPEAIFATMSHPERCAITHYFFPAEKNPLVEIVAAETGSTATVQFLMSFYELIGKFPVQVRSRYGYAVDPVFEGLFLAAALAVERGMGTPQTIDAVCQKALGQGVGPFTAMNLTGGNPLTQIGLSHYHEKIMPFFRVPNVLEDQIAKREPWPTAGKGEEIVVGEAEFQRIAEWMQGAYFALTSEILDKNLIDISDFDEALALGLAMKPAFSLMNQLGVARALALVEQFARDNDGVVVANVLKEQAKRNAPWRLREVICERRGATALVTLRRFKVLNALSTTVLEQLKETFDELRNDRNVSSVVLRGFGHRAFVSGADIRELATLTRPEDATRYARRGQQIFSLIESFPKPVIAAMNGLALGGGNELAMACHARIGVRDLKVFAGQPEPKLGVIPGYGGTQRLPRLVGITAAWPLLRSGNPIGSAHAKAIGLIDEEVALEELLPCAIRWAEEAASGKRALKPIQQTPLAIPESLPEVALNGLSTKIDAILQKAILDGAKTTLEQGLEIEALAFGECLNTEDMKLGMKNFLENGPKVSAKFLHR